MEVSERFDTQQINTMVQTKFKIFHVKLSRVHSYSFKKFPGFNAVVEKTPGIHKVAAVPVVAKAVVPVPHHGGHGGHHGGYGGPHGGYGGPHGGYGGPHGGYGGPHGGYGGPHHGGHGGHHEGYGGPHHGGYGHGHHAVPVLKAKVVPAYYGGHVASAHSSYGNHVTHFAPKVSYAPAIAAIPHRHHHPHHDHGHGYGHY